MSHKDFKLSRDSDLNDESSRGARYIARQSRHVRVKITLFKSEIIVTAGGSRLFVRFIFKPLYNRNLRHASQATHWLEYLITLTRLGVDKVKPKGWFKYF